MNGSKLLTLAGQGKNRVIKRPGKPKKSDVPGGARGGMGAEQFDRRITVSPKNSD